METVFVLDFTEKGLGESGFALWRRLWSRALPKEIYSIEEGTINLLRLPIPAEEIPYMGARSRKLLFRRLEQAIPSGALCLCGEKELFSPFLREADSSLLKILGTFYLPAVLGALRQQWGFEILGNSVTVVAESGILPLAQALAPFVRSLDVVSTEIPLFEEQNYAWEEWGLAICFRKSVPPETRLIIFWDEPEEEYRAPKDAISIGFCEHKKRDILPGQIFFHVPKEYAPLSSALGGVDLCTVTLLAEQLFEEENPGERLSKQGFSVSRIAWKNRKKDQNSVANFGVDFL